MTLKLYDFGTHECVDRTYIVMEMLSYVSDHPQVKANPEWSDLADKAHTALWALYQSLGSYDDVPTMSGEFIECLMTDPATLAKSPSQIEIFLDKIRGRK